MRPTKLILYRDKAREYRWKLVAGNGRVICASSEGFTTSASRRANIYLVCMAFISYRFGVKTDGERRVAITGWLNGLTVINKDGME